MAVDDVVAVGVVVAAVVVAVDGEESWPDRQDLLARPIQQLDR